MPISPYANNFQQNYDSIQVPSVIEKVHAEEQLEKLYQLGILKREKETPASTNQPQKSPCFSTNHMEFKAEKPLKSVMIDNQQDDLYEQRLHTKKASFIMWKMFYFNQKELQQVQKMLSLRMKKQCFQLWNNFIYKRRILAEKSSIVLNRRAQLSILRWRQWLIKQQKLHAFLDMKENGLCCYQKVLKRFVFSRLLLFLEHFREIRCKLMSRQLKKQHEWLSICFNEWKMERFIKSQRLNQLQKLFDAIALYSRCRKRLRNTLEDQADTILVHRIRRKLMTWREMIHQKVKLQASTRQVERLVRHRFVNVWRNTLEYHYIIQKLRERVLHRHKCEHWAAWKFVVKTNAFERSIQLHQDRNIGRICLREWKKVSTIICKHRQLLESNRKRSKRLFWRRWQVFLHQKQKKKYHIQLALEFAYHQTLKKYFQNGWLVYYQKYQKIFAFKRSIVYIKKKSQTWTKWLVYHQNQQQKVYFLKKYQFCLLQKCFKQGFLVFYHAKVIQTHQQIKARVFFQQNQMVQALQSLKKHVDKSKYTKNQLQKTILFCQAKYIGQWIQWFQLKKQNQNKVAMFQSCFKQVCFKTRWWVKWTQFVCTRRQMQVAKRFYQQQKFIHWYKNIQLTKKIHFYITTRHNQMKQMCLQAWYQRIQDKDKQTQLYALASKIYWKKKLVKVFIAFHQQILYLQKINSKKQKLTEKNKKRVLKVIFTKWGRLFYQTRAFRMLTKTYLKRIYTICWSNWKQKTVEKIHTRQKRISFQQKKLLCQLTQVFTKWSTWTKQMQTLEKIKRHQRKTILVTFFQLFKAKVLTRKLFHHWHCRARRQALVFHQRGQKLRFLFNKSKQQIVQNCFKQWMQVYFTTRLENEQLVICKMYLLKELKQTHFVLTTVYKYKCLKWFRRLKRRILWREHGAEKHFRRVHLTKVLNKWWHVVVALKQERILQNARQQMKSTVSFYTTPIHNGLTNMIDEDTFSIIHQSGQQQQRRQLSSGKQLKKQQRKVQFDLFTPTSVNSTQQVKRGQQQPQQQQQYTIPNRKTSRTGRTGTTKEKQDSPSPSPSPMRAQYSSVNGYAQRFEVKRRQSITAKCPSSSSIPIPTRAALVVQEQERSPPTRKQFNTTTSSTSSSSSSTNVLNTSQNLLLEDCLANFTGEVDDIEKWLANSMEQATKVFNKSTNSVQPAPVVAIEAVQPAVVVVPSPSVVEPAAVAVLTEESRPSIVSPVNIPSVVEEMVEPHQEKDTKVLEREEQEPKSMMTLGSLISSEDHDLLNSLDEEMKRVEQLLTSSNSTNQKDSHKEKHLASTSSTCSIEVDTTSTSSSLPQSSVVVVPVEIATVQHSTTTNSKQQTSSVISSDELSLETLVGLDPYSPKRPPRHSQVGSMLESQLISLQELSECQVDTRPMIEDMKKTQQLEEHKDLFVYHYFFNTVLTYYTNQLTASKKKGTFKGILFDMLRDFELLREDFYLTQINHLLNQMSTDDLTLIVFLEQVAKIHPCLDFVRAKPVQLVDQVDMLSKELGVSISINYFQLYPNVILLLKNHIVPLLLSLQDKQQKNHINWWTCPHQIPWVMYTQEDFLVVIEKNVKWIQQLLKTILLKDGCPLEKFLQFAQECKLMPRLFTSRQLTTCFKQSCGSFTSTERAGFVELVECLVRCSLLFKAPVSPFDIKESRLDSFIKKTKRPSLSSSSSCSVEETNLMTLLYAIEGKGSILQKPMKEIHPRKTATTTPTVKNRPSPQQHQVIHKTSAVVTLKKRPPIPPLQLPRSSLSTKASGSMATEVKPLPKCPPPSRPPPLHPLLQSRNRSSSNKDVQVSNMLKEVQQQSQPSKKTLLLDQLYKQEEKEMKKRTSGLLYNDDIVNPSLSTSIITTTTTTRPRSSMSVRPTFMVTPCSPPVKQIKSSSPPKNINTVLNKVDTIEVVKDSMQTQKDMLLRLLELDEVVSASEEEETIYKEVATMLNDCGILVDKSPKKKKIVQLVRPPVVSNTEDFVFSTDNLDLKSVWRTMFSKDSMENLEDIFEDAQVDTELTQVEVKDPFLNHLTNVDRFAIARTTKKQFELSQTPPLSSVLFHGIHSSSNEPVSSHVLAQVNDRNLDLLTNPLTNPQGTSNYQLFGVNDEEQEMDTT